MTYYYTSVNCTYLPRARVLAQTLKEHNPDIKFCVLLCDITPSALIENMGPFDIVWEIKDLDIPVDNINLWIFKHSVREIATAIKAQGMLKLMNYCKADKVIYLDPDMAVFENLAPLEALLDQYDCVLTPHITRPAPTIDTILEEELPLLHAGIYNLGFIAVKNNKNGQDIARYWNDRLLNYCYDDYGNRQYKRGLYADQKWCNLIPSFFDNVYLLKKSGYNVARWNYSSRKLSKGTNGKYLVNGEPLMIFHFSYWETGSEEGVVSASNDWYSVQGHFDKCLKELSCWYAERNRESLLEFSNSDDYKFIYNYFSNGHIIKNIHRIVLRDSPQNLMLFQHSDPFIVDSNPDCYFNWINRHLAQSENVLSSDISTSMIVDLQDEIKLLRSSTSWRITAPLRHLNEIFKRFRGIPKALASKQNNLGDQPHISKGLNVTGFIKGDFGTAHSARAFIRSSLAAKIPTCAIDSVIPIPHSCTNQSCNDIITSDFLYNTTLWCYNADMIPNARSYVEQSNWQGRYNIGLWYWEAPDFPDEWVPSFQPLNEVWAASEFTAKSIRNKSPIPVHCIPLAVELDMTNIHSDRTRFGLPEDAFLFITMYDVYSVNERKNPQAVLEAFHLATKNISMNVGLVLKINNPSANSSEIAALEEMVSGYPNIHIIAKTLHQDDVYSLINCCDALVSLHRSEGFGLSPAEAMYLGKPAIATGWSGNMEYMTKDNSCVVDYKLVRLGQDHGPYKAYQHWADADIQNAADYMTRLVQDPAYYHRIASAGQNTIKTHFSYDAIGKRIRQRLESIHQL